MASNGLFFSTLGLIATVIFAMCTSKVNCIDALSIKPVVDVASLNRNSFPPGFIFGAGSSSYQFEGAANEGGREPSVWDTFTHKYPDKIRDGSNGDVAIDSYHHIKEDVAIIKDMNLDSYRFSISWSRILPNVRDFGKVQKGLRTGILMRRYTYGTAQAVHERLAVSRSSSTKM